MKDTVEKSLIEATSFWGRQSEDGHESDISLSSTGFKCSKWLEWEGMNLSLTKRHGLCFCIECDKQIKDSSHWFLFENSRSLNFWIETEGDDNLQPFWGTVNISKEKKNFTAEWKFKDKRVVHALDGLLVTVLHPFIYANIHLLSATNKFLDAKTVDFWFQTYCWRPNPIWLSLLFASLHFLQQQICLRGNHGDWRVDNDSWGV